MRKTGKSNPPAQVAASALKPPAPVRLKHLPAALTALFLTTIFLLHLFTIRPGLDWGDDFAIYLSHAINIANHRPYADTGYLVNPYFYGYAPAAYPPGFPLMLAPLMLVCPPAGSLPDLFPYKLFVTLCLILALWLIDRLLRDDLPIYARFAVLAGVALTPYILGFKNAIVSDIPFMAAAFAALLLARRAEEDGLTHKQQMTRAALAALVMFFAAQVRSIGAVLPVAFIVAQLIRHRRITPQASITFVVYTLGAILFSLLKVSNDSYFSVLGVYRESFFDTVGAQLQYIPRFHGTALERIWLNPWTAKVLWPVFDEDRAVAIDSVGIGIALAQVMTLLCVLLAGAGLILRLRPALRSVEMYFIAYYGVLLIYPTPQDYRLLIPIIPLFFFYVAVALKALVLSKKLRPIGVMLSITIVGVTLACFISYYPHVQRESVPNDLTAPDAQQALDFIKQNTQPADRILCSKPRAVALFAQRYATPLAWSEDPEYAWNQVRTLRPRYLFLGKQFIDNEQVMLPWAYHFKNVFTPVFRNERYTIFRIDPDAAPKDNQPDSSRGL
jgi:hypothetical protein